MEKTFAIIKPDVVAAKNAGKVVSMIESSGFDILRMEKKSWTKADAEQFYAIHKERPFFGELVEFMTSGPIIMMVLEKDGAVVAWRDLMGATNPAEAADGTVRKLYGTDIGTNATHGSDAAETAKLEIGQFYSELV
jgi:nucleoside-diphosphate kinase